jgi:hypothetical protein
MNIKERNPYKLLVEGNEDQHVIWSLCECNKLTENFDVIDCNGVKNLLLQLETRLLAPQNNQRIGIVVDADIEIKKRWEAIVSKISSIKEYDCEKITLPKTGLIIDPIDDIYPKIGIWIMPDNSTAGMLEDFAVSLADENNPLMQKAEDTISEIEQDTTFSNYRFKDVHRAKAKIHTFLAWQDEPGKPMGQAITAHILNSKSPHAEVFINWLKRLFG